MDLMSIPQQVPEICLLGPSAQLVQNVERVRIQKGMPPIGLFVAVLDEALPIAKILEKRGAKVLVSRKGTADVLQKNLSTQVVKINTTMNDYLRHMDLMRGHKGRIGIVEYYTFIPELEKMCQYIGVSDVLLYSYDSTENYEQAVKDAVNGPATILFGGGATLPAIMEKLRFPHTVVENSDESISNALDVAMQLLNLQREEAEKQARYRLLFERYSTVLSLTHDAVLATDSDGLITVVNPVALSFLQQKEEACIGQPLVRFFPQLAHRQPSDYRSPGKVERIIEWRGVYLSVNVVPILVNGNYQGAVYTFQSEKDIRTKEQNMRIHLQQKGHVAKYNFDNILGRSSAITRAKEVAAGYARTESTVLITGETGVGKELFAQSIHNSSNRRRGPFVAINCASLGKELLESQLFGYEEGAFTGAVRGGRAGLFEVAHGGTLFLDEIGEIPVETQTQLLRVLQEKEVRRVGGHKILPVDVRVICATNRDLLAETESGRFRADLFYRINILRLDIPPLRERTEDIPLMITSLLDGLSNDVRNKVEEHIKVMLPRLHNYRWPGNARELFGFIERIATLFSQGNYDVPDEVLLRDLRRSDDTLSPNIVPEQISRGDIENALARTGGSRVRAAAVLGISRSTLWRLMKRYGIS